MTTIICKGCKNYNKEKEQCNLNQVIIKNRRESIVALEPDNNKCISFKGKLKNATA